MGLKTREEVAALLYRTKPDFIASVVYQDDVAEDRTGPAAAECVAALNVGSLLLVHSGYDVLGFTRPKRDPSLIEVEKMHNLPGAPKSFGNWAIDHSKVPESDTGKVSIAEDSGPQGLLLLPSLAGDGVHGIETPGGAALSTKSCKKLLELCGLIQPLMVGGMPEQIQIRMPNSYEKSQHLGRIRDVTIRILDHWD